MRWQCQALLGGLLAACGQAQPQRWEAVTIDGRPASGFMLATRGDEVVGGRDGCNGWGLDKESGMIVSDAQECPPDPMRDAYWAVAMGRDASRTRVEDRLIARTPRHSAVFKREH